ncbi:MAG: serine/threonine protein kinase [Candidatus Aminicenantes bacterium]|nr:serine/threonine protein kinase [Candidatus Aminicenantes bacterium]
MKRNQDDPQSTHCGHTLAADKASTSIPAGTRIADRYRLVRFLGSGGFAAVYEAVDEILNEKVALKVFHQDVNLERNRMLRIKREINLSRRIADPRVVKVFSLDRWRDRWFLVMELVEGETLQQHLDRKGAWSWQAFRPVFLEILAGVSALHALRVVHRDIKPSNVMLIRNGGVKILDFGLAKELGDPERSVRLDEVVGTPRYLSPEQLKAAEVDVRSDVFQLGLLLQTVLRGAPPLKDLDTLSVLAHRMGRTPVALKLDGLRVPVQVRLGLQRALRRLPAGRFRDAIAMHAYFSSPQVSRTVFWTWLRKSVPVAAFLLIAGVVAATWFWTSREPAIPARVQIEGNHLQLLDDRGQIMWVKDFSPRSVYRAVLQPCRPPLQLFRSNVGVNYLVNVFLSSNESMDFQNQPTLGSTEADGRLMQIDASGKTVRNISLSALIRAGDYGFIPRAYLAGYDERDLDGDGLPEVLTSVVHARGMFPGALLLLAKGRLFQVTAPGHIGNWSVVPEQDRAWLLTIEGQGNRMAHLKFVARLRLRYSGDGSGFLVKLIPHLDDKRMGSDMQVSWLIYVPRNARFPEGRSLAATGSIELVTGSGDRLRIEDNGTVRLQDGDRQQVFPDSPQTLAKAYKEIHLALQARDLRYDLEEAAVRLESAENTGLENPWLKSAVAFLRGDVEVRRGRYANGRRLLRRALDLYPENNDAAHRLLEAVFIESGPEKALSLMDGELEKYGYFWGLAFGREFFRGLCLLQKGDFASARLFSGRVQQEEPRNAELLRSLIGLMRGEPIAGKLPRNNRDMSLLYTWEEYRLLEGRAHLLAGDTNGRGEFCFLDVHNNSRLRRHLAAMSMAWYILKDNRADEAERMARSAFANLQERIRGDLETRFWWFYDAWVFGRIMDELGQFKEALRGYRACITANPHTYLADAARRRMTELQVAKGF